MITDTGRSGLALLMAGGGDAPDFIAIGSGSGLVAITNTALLAERDRNTAIVASGTTQEVQFTANWTSTEISGTTLFEFGTFSVVAGGSCWNREGFGSIVFDGTNELQIQETFQIF